jgi:CDP-3, 6-dideoxy-D-glycero-L-glycero-4-hexulose-4-reductase
MSKELKCALITGSTGYIGGKLAVHLADQGWHISLLVRPGVDKSLHPHLDKCNWYEYDGTVNSLHKISIDSNKCVVFHLAAYASVKKEFDSIDLLIESNILLGMHLLSFMQYKNLSHIIFTETYWQFDKYGNDNPNTLYAATKMAFSNILKYSSKHGINSTCLVLYDVYGLDDDRPKLINHLLKERLSKGVIKLSSGKQIMDYIHIDDVLKAFHLVAESMLSSDDIAYSRFAVRSMKEKTLKEYVEIILSNINANYKVRWGAIDYPKYQIMSPWLPSQNHSPPGWVPKISFTEIMENALINK